MNIKKQLLTAVAAITFTAACIPINSAAEKTHTVTVMGYNDDGSPIAVLTVPHGNSVDLSEYESSPTLNYHADEYTQVGFGQWSECPEAVTEDVTIHALSVKMTIECSGKPSKTEYYSKSGKVKTNGLEVIITKYTQLPEKDENGSFITDIEVTDISDACTTSPAVIDKAFLTKNTTSVSVIPPGSNRAILTYDINYFEGLGDADENGVVDASDASKILEYYAMFLTGKTPDLTEQQQLVCDVDRNNIIEASDAAQILIYYAASLTSHEEVSWDDIL